MEDVTTLQDLELSQSSTAANPVVTVARKISDSETSLITSSTLVDKDGATITKACILGIRKSNGYVENVYVAAGGITGTAVTMTTRGLPLGGIDLTTSVAANAVSHEQGEEVFLNVSPFILQQLTYSLQGYIGASIKLKDVTTFQDEGMIAVRDFANAAARDAAITSPVDGMICYLQDIEDYTAYKNAAWVIGLGGGGGTATFYQDSTDDATLTGAIDGVNKDYDTQVVPGSVNALIVVKNGLTLERGASDDYTLSGNTITMTTAPVTGDKIVAIYPDSPVGTGNAKTRATSDADADNGELYRSTDDSSKLYYKDNGGTASDIETPLELISAVTADATEINQLTGTTNIAEADTFFGATDITGAQAETLTDGSNADALHVHTNTKDSDLFLKGDDSTVTTSVTHTLGVIPSLITFSASAGFTIETSTMGLWTNSKQKSTYYSGTNSDYTIDLTHGISLRSGNTGVIGTITNVTSSGFDITWTSAGSLGSSTWGVQFTAFA